MDGPSTPSHTAHLLFPSASQPISKTASAISKSALSITNRLHSIVQDAAFVSDVAKALDLPVVANERCGSWYVAPELKKGSAYFKSTDGHWGQWGFSLRRLNLDVLKLAGEGSGCIIVDSTRRGKHLPDALSKTIPVWCAVFNRLIFPNRIETHKVIWLPEVTSSSEAAQIEARLAACVESARSLDLDLGTLQKYLTKPIKVYWIARSLDLLPPDAEEQARRARQYTPLYLVMASEHHDHRAIDKDTAYVQGAGDDIENWSGGLTPSVFWAHQEKLLATGEDELLEIIAEEIANERNVTAAADWTRIAQAPWLQIGTLRASQDHPRADVLTLCLFDGPEVEESGKRSSTLMNLHCRQGKSGSRDLRKLLPKIMNDLQASELATNGVRICCETSKDIAVGVALAILCRMTDQSGQAVVQNHKDHALDKAVIKRKLSWIMTSIPSASPSRATLNAVNDFLMNSASTSVS